MMSDKLPEILKARFVIEQNDCNGNLLVKENKSVMMIMTENNRWNCLSFTACGKTYSLQLTLDNEKYIIKLGSISPPGFVSESYRLKRDKLKGEYKPEKNSKCVDGIMSFMHNVVIL